MNCSCQAPLSMQFPRHEYWSGLPFPSLGNLPDSGIELTSPALAGRFFTTSATWEAQNSRAELTNKNANYRIPFLERASHVAQLVKHLPTMWETWVQFLGWEVPLEKEMATHSSILAWRIPWTEEPGSYSSWDLKSWMMT